MWSGGYFVPERTFCAVPGEADTGNMTAEGQEKEEERVIQGVTEKESENATENQAEKEMEADKNDKGEPEERDKDEEMDPANKDEKERHVWRFR